MESTKAKMMEKLSKLLAVTVDNNATPNEAEAAQKVAAQIMAKFNIESAEVMAKKEAENKTDEHHGVEKNVVKAFSDDHWQMILAGGVMKTFQCDCVQIKGWDGVKMNFFGQKEDLEMTVYFYTRLLRLITSMAYKAFPQKSFEGKRRDYCVGVVLTVNQRLKELYAKIEEVVTSDCREIMVLKGQLAEARANKEFPKAKKDKRKVKPSRELLQGVRDGHDVDLSSNRKKVD